MKDALFGARAQIAVGVFFGIITVFQGWYWGIHVQGGPNKAAIFWLSEEALLFACYGIIATGLGYRKTEHVETAVVENIGEVEKVEVNGDS